MDENFEIIDRTMKFKYRLDEINEIDKIGYRDHYHTEFELFYLIEGDIEFQIEQERYSINPHDVLLIRPGQHHNAIIRSTTPYARIVLRFSSTDITEALYNQIISLPEVFNIKGQNTEQAYKTLLDLQKNTTEKCITTALKYQLGIILCNLCSEVGSKKEAKYISKDLEKAIKFIEENLHNIHSEKDICSGINKSPSALRKLFIRNLNTPLMSYVRTKKCMKANELLKSGLPLKQIYRECGFNHYSTFYRDYLNTYGKSPQSQSQLE